MSSQICNPIRSALIALALLLLAALPANAGEAGPAPVFEGEAYTKTFVATAPEGDKLVEFVRETDSFENWTRLIAYRSQPAPAADNDPIRFAQAVERLLLSSKNTKSARLLVNKDKNEALIDFLTWTEKGGYMEFNVFRYAKSPDGKAVISIQLACRIIDTTAKGKEDFIQLRNRWLRQAAEYDLLAVHSALSSAQPTK